MSANAKVVIFLYMADSVLVRSRAGAHAQEQDAVLLRGILCGRARCSVELFGRTLEFWASGCLTAGKVERASKASLRWLGLHLFARGLKVEAGRAVLFAPLRGLENSPSFLVPVKCRKVRVTGGPERAFFGGASPRCLGDQSGDA